MRKEDMTKERIDSWLIRNNFEFEREVKSVCKTGTIDYIIKDKKSGAFFGIEVKQDFKRLKGREVGKHMKQAERYTHLKFKTKTLYHEPIQVMVLVTPAPSNRFREISFEYEKRLIEIKKENFTIQKNYYPLLHDFDSEHCNISSYISEVHNVGEIKKIESQNRTYVIFQFMNYKIWHSLHGLHYVNYNTYSPFKI